MYEIITRSSVQISVFINQCGIKVKKNSEVIEYKSACLLLNAQNVELWKFAPIFLIYPWHLSANNDTCSLFTSPMIVFQPNKKCSQGLKIHFYKKNRWMNRRWIWRRSHKLPKSQSEKIERLTDKCCVISDNKLTYLTPTTIKFEYVMNFPPFCHHCTMGFARGTVGFESF